MKQTKHNILFFVVQTSITNLQLFFFNKNAHIFWRQQILLFTLNQKHIHIIGLSFMVSGRISSKILGLHAKDCDYLLITYRQHKNFIKRACNFCYSTLAYESLVRC